MTSSLSPLAIVLAIIFALAVVGAIVALLFNLHKFSGFRPLARDAERIAHALQGELFRDGGDLVISGNLSRLPTVVRFSNKETVPGLNIRCGVPANFTLWIAPRSADPGEGRTRLHTGDAAFDNRFVTRSDDPGQARLFLALHAVPRVLQQLACSGGSFLAISPGSLEISEQEIPRDAVARHVLDHLQSVTSLAESLQQMPAADTVPVMPLPKERRILARAAIVVGTAAAFAVVVAATQRRARQENAVLPPPPAAASGISPLDAAHIAGIEGWRLATADDFAPDAVAWLRDSGAPVSGRIVGDFSGHGNNGDVAYVLVRPDGAQRIVLLLQGQDRFDVRYSKIAIVARIPRSSLPGIRWVSVGPGEVAGDGLLIVRAADDPRSGLVLFADRGRIVSAVPENYQALNPE